MHHHARKGWKCKLAAYLLYICCIYTCVFYSANDLLVPSISRNGKLLVMFCLSHHCNGMRVLNSEHLFIQWGLREYYSRTHTIRIYIRELYARPRIRYFFLYFYKQHTYGNEYSDCNIHLNEIMQREIA